MITLEQCQRIIEETFVAHVESFRELPSTNDFALSLAGDTTRERPLLVVAERQSAGRGRGSNRWWSDKGALTFSLLLDRVSALEGCLPMSLAVGVALCDTTRSITGKLGLGVKWPNDVYYAGRKVAGVLIERPSFRSGGCVLGIGLNVNNCMQSAPREIENSSTSLLQISGRTFDLHAVLIRLLQDIERVLDHAASDQEWLQRRWSQLCILNRQHVVIDAGNRRFSGRCRGIDATGALLVETQYGRERCISGIVQWTGQRVTSSLSNDACPLG